MNPEGVPLAPTTSRQHISDGHHRLNTGVFHAALYHFLTASKESPDALERTEALQMAGVTFRKYGTLSKAAEYGELAFKEAMKTGDAHFVSGTARDFAATLHALGITRSKERAATLRSALYYYDISLEYNTTAHQHPFKGDENSLEAARHVTTGMRGLLLFDIAHYRIWLNDDGSEPGQLTPNEVSREQNNAIDLLEESDYGLRQLGDVVWELNNLLKLIQVSSFGERLKLQRRASQLVAQFPVRKKEFWVSMLGRGAVRMTLRLQAWRHRQ